MTTDALPDTHLAVRQRVGYWLDPGLALLEVSGPDAAAFLHSQTTNDVRGLEPGGGQASASLDPKAHLIAAFTLHRTVAGDAFRLVVEAARKDALAGQLEKYHVLEDLAIVDRSADFALALVQGPRTIGLLSRVWPAVDWPAAAHAMVDLPGAGREAFAIWRSETGEDGFLLAVAPEAIDGIARRLIEAGEGFGLVEVDRPTREILRIEAGIPRHGLDIDADKILPATGLEQSSVSYDKGCYVGQEVVARVKTYGSVGQALVGLVFEGDRRPAAGATLAVAGKDVAEVRSGCDSPSLGAPIAMAYLHRDHRAAGRVLDLSDGSSTYRAKVTLLPFYQPTERGQRAAALTEAGQRAFAAGDTDGAIARLREAIQIDPKDTEAYESLGVILGRLERFEEALAVMKRLAEIDPEEPMAFTNISLYYMKLGHREEAERAQGQAALLSMRRQARIVRTEKAEAERRASERQALEARLGMFRQVLEIDADDHLATFGLGKGLLDLDRPAEALPHLRRALEIKDDHSVGFVALGRCLEAIDRPAEAAEVYDRGIAVATRRGDLMPLAEMQRRLGALGAGDVS